VYKALETLVTCGLAVKLSYGDDAARYDARTDDHFHSRCVRCGRVRDLPGDSREVVPRLRVGDGFEVQGYRVEVVGVCLECAG
jgi:Fur family transcriptional regulator, peroxide stress response regulator